MDAELPLQTLVTCLYDLEKREKGGRRRSIEFYYQHGCMVMELEQPLVAFVDPEIAPRISEIRRAKGMAHLTRVISKPLEHWPLFACLPQWEQARPFSNANHHKDTPLHQLIAWSKLDMLEQAMDINPFKTDHFAWIDFGLGHVASIPLQFPAPTQQISMLEICATAPSEIEDPLRFLGTERHRIAGGFFRGGETSLRLFIRRFQSMMAELLDKRIRTTEQMIFALLNVKNPEMFKCYYGDYNAILKNWDGIRCDLHIALDNLAHCRLHGLWDRAIQIAECGLRSWQENSITPDENELARLMDESFTAAWYANRPEIAVTAASHLTGKLSKSNYFILHRERILQNLDFLEKGQLPNL